VQVTTCPLVPLQEQRLWGMHEHVSVVPQAAGREAQNGTGHSASHPSILTLTPQVV
jgi:hypothetical protein